MHLSSEHSALRKRHHAEVFTQKSLNLDYSELGIPTKGLRLNQAY